MYIKSRVELARYFNKLGFKKGAEIGVADGKYSEILCQSIPGLELFCIDIWAPYPGNGHRYKEEDYRYGFEMTQKRLGGFKAKLIRAMSMDAVKNFADESLDFVFIDANHAFDYVMEDIIHWSKKVRRGGVVSGHDYYHSRSGRMGVIEAVDAYTKAHKLSLNLTGKISDSADDKEPSFWWIKT